MTKKTTREIYKKSEHTKAEVQAEADIRMSDGAVSAEVTSEGDNWVLVIIDKVFSE